MEQQINQAVEIALGNSSQELKTQAISFINEIKSTKDGYHSVLNILLGNQQLNDEFKFFIYQVIDENLPNLDDKELYTLDNQLMGHMNTMMTVQETNFIKNKFCNIMAKVFCKNYLTINPMSIKTWLKFLDDYQNDSKIDYYLRWMIAVHDEIGDKLINRDNFTNERNILLKDKIRVHDMQDLVKSWQKILTKYTNGSNNTNLNNILLVIGNYVQWMEISLFVSHNFINIIIDLIINQNATSCLTLIEIISKKMKSENKFALINLLDLSTLFQNYGKFDINFLEILSKLINAIGYELCVIIDNSPDMINLIMNHLNYLWPLVFKFLLNDFDEISIQVLPFIQYYLTLSKKHQLLINNELFKTLLFNIIIKSKFDQEIDDDDETEEFNEFRLKLKFFQDLIASLTPDLYLSVLPMTINYLLFNEGDVPELSPIKSNWDGFELGLYEFNCFSDSIKNNLINYPKAELTTSKPYELVNNLFIKLINLPLDNFKHELIQLNLFDIIVKNYNLLNNDIKHNIQLISTIFSFFESSVGFNNGNNKVKIRCCYQFLKFIKLIKPGLINDESILENLLQNLISNNLLAIKSELPKNDDDSDLADNGYSSEFQNQLYLFESIGLLISICNISHEFKLKLMDLILLPIFQNLENLVKLKQSSSLFIDDNTNSTTNKTTMNDEVQLIILQCHHTLLTIGTFIKGFNYDQAVMKNLPDLIISKIHECSRIIIIVLENFRQFDSIRESSRFAFARIIPILKDLIINELNKLISIVLSVNNLKLLELSDFISFINQIIHIYDKNENIYNLLNNLLTPLINKIFEILLINSDDDLLNENLTRDKNSLIKMFLNLISTIILNHKTSLLITETNKNLLPTILSKIFENVYNFNNNNDYSLNKLAISQLVNFVTVFQNGKIIDNLDVFNNSTSVIEGIDEYLINNSIILSFELPFKLPNFNKSIITEISVLLKTLVTKNENFPNILANYLAEKGMNDNLKIEFVNNLIKLDQKDFKKYFSDFVIQMNN